MFESHRARLRRRQPRTADLAETKFATLAVARVTLFRALHDEQPSIAPRCALRAVTFRAASDSSSLSSPEAGGSRVPHPESLPESENSRLCVRERIPG